MVTKCSRVGLLSVGHWRVPSAELPARVGYISRSLRILSVFAGLLATGCNTDPNAKLLEQLHSAEANERRAAARELGKLPTLEAPVVAALTESVADDDAETRRLACVALRHAAPHGSSSVPALERALADHVPAVTRAAAWAIYKIDPKNTHYQRVILESMRAGDGRTMLEVGALGPDAQWAVPTLIALLGDSSEKVRALAAQTLGRIGPAAAVAKVQLQRLLTDQSPAVQDAAKAALTQIER
jgi:HEAT repeat protein